MKKRYKSDSLDYLRMHYIDELRIAMSQLKKVAEENLKKIEEVGISGYYSIGSDVGRYSERAYRASWVLGQMKRLEDKLSEEIDRGIEKKLTKLIESLKIEEIEEETEK